jgi:hypothetical protein
MSQHEIDMGDERQSCQYCLKLVEAIYADAVASEITKLCQVNECSITEGWQTYGIEAAERVNKMHLVWDSFVESARILKINRQKEVLEHLREFEKAPDQTFVYDLRELHHSKKSRQLQCVLNYLSFWREK